MRILTVVSSLGRGGIEKVSANYTLGYREAGHDVAILAIQEAGVRADVLSTEGVEIFVGGIQQTAQLTAIKQAVDWNPDVVHVHRPGISDPVTGRALRELRENVNPLILEKNAFARIDYSSDRSLIDIHLVLSEWCLWKWQRWARSIKPKPVVTIAPNIVSQKSFYRESLDKVAAFKAELGIPSDSFVFGRIGQPISAKWSSHIITAFATIAENYFNTYLLLADPPTEIRKLIDQLPPTIQKRIITLPFVYKDEDLRVFYSALDIFLHTAAIGESFGSVLVEAMMCDVPVITLSTPVKDNSQVEVVGHMKGGMVAGNEAGMIACMTQLITDDKMRRQLASGCRQWAVSRFDTSAVIPRILRIIELARPCTSRCEMATILEQDADIITQVNHSCMMFLLRNTVGKPSLKERILINLVHVPWLYRAWYSLRRLRQRYIQARDKPDTCYVNNRWMRM